MLSIEPSTHYNPAMHLLSISDVLHNADHSAWLDMFRLSIPWGEKIIRSVVVYVFLFIGIRIAGRRELAQLNPFDFIVLMLLSNTVQNAIIGDDNTITGGILGAATLLIVNFLVVRFMHRHRKVQRLLQGTPEVLIKDGHVDMHVLDREMITRQELLAACHAQGIASLHEVHRAILEPTGTISFLEAKPSQDDVRHDKMMAVLKRLSEDVAELKAARGQ
jgi:uncharacterized membrane protein YcaP (DUF421 family)